MIYIKKNTEPPMLTTWKKNHPQKTYRHLKPKHKRILRKSLLKEQGFICCFCGDAIGMKYRSNIIQIIPKKNSQHNIRNAHIVPQSVNTSLTLDYNNICASCDSVGHSDKHCDVAQENNKLPITPLQPDCLSFFCFQADGTIYPNPQKTPEEQKRASQTIKILNLDCPFLNQQRESILKSAASIAGTDVTLLNNLCHKNASGAFAPFFFVPLRYYQLL